MKCTVGQFDDDAVVEGFGQCGNVERVHVALSYLSPDIGHCSVQRRNRFGEPIAQISHLRVDVAFDNIVDQFQNCRFDAVEDVRSERVDGTLFFIHSFNGH